MTNEVNDRKTTENLDTNSRKTRTLQTSTKECDGNDNKYRKGSDNIYLHNSNLEIKNEVVDFEISVPTAPDGGWGWVVCFGSFVVNFILDGTLFSFGILMLALLDDLGYDKYTTAWIGSTQMGIHMAIGPLISLALQYFSIRQVTMAGSIISAAGFVASAFAPNIYILIFTYGIIGGIGIGMVFLPAIIVVGLYFDRKRALATGIATSGSGVGTFVYGYITNIALSYFSWRGTVFILGGLILNCLVCGMCFRPLSLQRRARITKFSKVLGDNERVEYDTFKPLIEESASCTGHPVNFNPKKSLSAMEDCRLNELVYGAGDSNLTQPVLPGSSNDPFSKIQTASDVSLASEGARQGEGFTSFGSMSHSLGDSKLRNYVTFRDDPGPTGANNVGKCHMEATGIKIVKHGATPHRDAPDQNCEATNNISSRDCGLSLTPVHLHDQPESVSYSCHQYRATDGKCYSSDYISLVAMVSSASQEEVTPARYCSKSEPKLSVHLDDTEASNPCHGHMSVKDSKSQIKGSIVSDLKEVKNSALCKLLTNKLFLLLLLTFSMWTAQSITLTYIPDLAVSLNIQQSDAAFLISIIGIANILGRLLAGFVTDCFHIPSIWLYFVALIVAAGTNLIISFSPLFPSSLIVLQICSAVFGLCMAVAVSMRTIVLADQLGIETLTVSFGVVALFQGLAFSVNPPIAGQLIDDLQSFRPPFVMAASMYAVSALATLIVGCISGTQSHR